MFNGTEATQAQFIADWLKRNNIDAQIRGEMKTGIMGGKENAIVLIDGDGAEDWPRMPKEEVAMRLAERQEAGADAQTGEEDFLPEEESIAPAEHALGPNGG